MIVWIICCRPGNSHWSEVCISRERYCEGGIICFWRICRSCGSSSSVTLNAAGLVFLNVMHSLHVDYSRHTQRCSSLWQLATFFHWLCRLLPAELGRLSLLRWMIVNSWTKYVQHKLSNDSKVARRSESLYQVIN